jgi:hypothetical protein
MNSRPVSLLGLILTPLLALASPACDDEDNCPAGQEGCVCAEDFQCDDGLVCLSEYCVSSVADGSGGSGNASDPSGGGSSNNNVEACEAFLDNLDCALPEGALDCSVYTDVACDVTDYLDCLTENSACNGDMIDVSGWGNCISFVEECV